MEIIAKISVSNSTDAFQISNIDIKNASFKFINLSSANKNSWIVSLWNKLENFSPRVNNNVIIVWAWFLLKFQFMQWMRRKTKCACFGQAIIALCSKTLCKA